MYHEKTKIYNCVYENKQYHISIKLMCIVPTV